MRQLWCLQALLKSQVELHKTRQAIEVKDRTKSKGTRGQMSNLQVQTDKQGSGWVVIGVNRGTAPSWSTRNSYLSIGAHRS